MGTLESRLAALERATRPGEPRHQILIADPTDAAGPFAGLSGADLDAAIDARLADLPPMRGIRAIVAREPKGEGCERLTSD